MIVERRAEVENLQHDLQGRCYDMEYSLRWPWLIFPSSNNGFILIIKYIDHFSAIKSIDKADESLKNIHELLKSSIFLKQQLKCDEAQRRPNTANNQSSSVYKRLSGNTFASVAKQTN